MSKYWSGTPTADVCFILYGHRNVPRAALRRIRRVCASVCVTRLVSPSFNRVPPSRKGVGVAKAYLLYPSRMRNGEQGGGPSASSQRTRNEVILGAIRERTGLLSGGRWQILLLGWREPHAIEERVPAGAVELYVAILL